MTKIQFLQFWHDRERVFHAQHLDWIAIEDESHEGRGVAKSVWYLWEFVVADVEFLQIPDEVLKSI